MDASALKEALGEELGSPLGFNGPERPWRRFVWCELRAKAAVAFFFSFFSGCDLGGLLCFFFVGWRVFPRKSGMGVWGFGGFGGSE